MSDSPRERLNTGAANDPVRQVSDAIWRDLGRHRGVLDATDLGTVALVLVYLRSRPVWEMLADGASDIEQAIHADVSADQHGPRILRPVLDLVRAAEDARQLEALLHLVGRYNPASVSFAQVFSTILDRMALDGGRKGAGEFHTPRSITDLAAALLTPAPNSRIFDPCCKGGGFLAAILDQMTFEREDEGQPPMVSISDYSARSCALAYLSLRMRGVTPEVLPNPAVSLPAGAANQRFDVVTTNPPFNLANWKSDQVVEGRWMYEPPPEHSSNYAWLQYVVASLRDGGHAAVVMPVGAGFSENPQESRIRRAMVEDGVISAVIALPAQLFANTAIPVTMWLLERSTVARPNEVLFVDASELGTMPERARRSLTDTDIERIVEAYGAWRDLRLNAVSGFAVGVSIEHLRDAEYKLNPRAHMAPTDVLPDIQEETVRVRGLAQQLRRLTEQAGNADRVIEGYLEELSL